MKQPTKILIGIPISDDYRVHMGVMLYAALEKESGICGPPRVVPTDDVSTGRNILVEETLEGGFTHLYQVDSDTVPKPKTLDRLLGYDKDIVGGVYPIYTPETGPRWSASIYEPDRDERYWNPVKYKELPKELFRAHLMGAGILLIKRKVFEAMEPPWFERTHMKKDLISEDLLFCAKAKKLGFSLWADPTKCSHFKSNVDLKQMFDSCIEQFG